LTPANLQGPFFSRSPFFFPPLCSLRCSPHFLFFHPPWSQGLLDNLPSEDPFPFSPLKTSPPSNFFSRDRWFRMVLPHFLLIFFLNVVVVLTFFFPSDDTTSSFPFSGVLIPPPGKFFSSKGTSPFTPCGGGTIAFLALGTLGPAGLPV